MQVRAATERRPTLRDVAERAGVSLKTASRAVNGEAGVSAGVASAVSEAVAELGYTRHEGAAGLRRGGQSTRSLGLVIEDITNPFYAVIAGAIEERARERGFVLLSTSSNEDPEREAELLRAFCERRVDGLAIVPSASDHSFLAQEVDRGTAVVFVDRPSTGLLADTVISDNRVGASQGVAHLLQAGHRRIAFVGDHQSIATARHRHDGYADALGTEGLGVDPALVRTGIHDTQAAWDAARSLLDLVDPPTAIFTGNNLITVGVYRSLRNHRADVAMVGFDDFELADLLDPPVTVVAQDTRTMGLEAARLLLDRIDRPGGPPQTLTLPTTLVVRDDDSRPA
jgi:LacI family transcriptional regulator